MIQLNTDEKETTQKYERRQVREEWGDVSRAVNNECCL